MSMVALVICVKTLNGENNTTYNNKKLQQQNTINTDNVLVINYTNIMTMLTLMNRQWRFQNSRHAQRSAFRVIDIGTARDAQ